MTDYATHDRSDTVRRTVFSSSAPPDAHDPDSTPRPAHAFPASLEVGLNHPNHGANPQYWNYQFHTDGDGVASRTAEGPRDLITDPALTDRDIYAHKKLFATPGTREPLDPGRSFLYHKVSDWKCALLTM